jgi:hypothetical protein
VKYSKVLVLSLIKKIVFGVFVILSVVLGVWGYNALKQNKKPSKDILALMPDSCIFYCSTKNFSDLSVKLNSQNLIFNSWKVFSEVKQFERTFHYFDSLIYSNELIKEITSNNMLHFALYQEGNSTAWLAALNLKELKQENDVLGLCSSMLKLNNEEYFNIGNGNVLFVEQGALMISNSSALIKRTIETGNKLKDDRSFIEQLENVGQSDAMRVYLNHQLFNEVVKQPHLKVSALLDASESVAGIKFSPNEIIINGNYRATPSLLQNVIRSQEAQNIELYEQIPFGCNWFQAIAISNNSEFQRVVSTNETSVAFWKGINNKALYNAANEFYGTLYNSVIEFNSFNSKAICMSLLDSVKCEEVIALMSDSDSLYENVRIHKLNNEVIVPAIYGRMFDVKASHAFVLNNALYFTESETAAREICFSVKNSATLKNNVPFMAYANENINTNCSYIHYFVPNSRLGYMKQFTSFNLEGARTALDNLTNANLVVTRQKGNLKFRMQLNYQSPSTTETPNLLWQCAIDSNAVDQPYLFTNHNSQESEIVVQDKLDQLYLISSTGSILWKKKINETLRSKIYTVDIFKNKKYQMLFNTDNYLHLIDRNGNYVQGYPIKLPAKASNAISLIDYNGDKDFRIFIACSNNTIYNFNLYGVRSEGYKPYKTDALVKLPVKFVRVGESDYLITMDEEGVIHAFSRKGEGRIGFKNKGVENCQDFAVVATNNINSTFLYYVDDRNSLVNKISFADKKDVVKLRTDLTNAHIVFENVNDDQLPDFISQSENGINAYDINGSVIYENSKLSTNGIGRSAKLTTKQMFYAFDKEKQKTFFTSNTDLNISELNTASQSVIFNLFKDNKSYVIYSYNGKLLCNLLK